MICKECGGEFVLNPGKPGFANVCPACSEPPELLARKAEAAVAMQEAKKTAAKANKKIRKKAEREKREYDALLEKANRWASGLAPDKNEQGGKLKK
jgi:hypothetical protein